MVPTLRAVSSEKPSRSISREEDTVGDTVRIAAQFIPDVDFYKDHVEVYNGEFFAAVIRAKQTASLDYVLKQERPKAEGFHSVTHSGHHDLVAWRTYGLEHRHVIVLQNYTGDPRAALRASRIGACIFEYVSQHTSGMSKRRAVERAFARFRTLPDTFDTIEQALDSWLSLLADVLPSETRVVVVPWAYGSSVAIDLL